MSELVGAMGPDLDPAARQAVLARLPHTVASHFEGISDLAVVPSHRDVEAAVAGGRRDRPRARGDPTAVLGAVEPILRDGIVHTGHPGYLTVDQGLHLHHELSDRRDDDRVGPAPARRRQAGER